MMAALPWDSYAPGSLYMGNLTYHRVPADGVRCKDDLRAWFRALDRILGGRDKWGCIWVMEFQKRGSLHFHFVLKLEPMQAIAETSLDNQIVRQSNSESDKLIKLENGSATVLRGDQWHEIVDAWLRITGESEDGYAVLHGVQLSRVQNIRAVKVYESKYMGKAGRNNAKAYEKVAPAWFTNCGRWWGVQGAALTPAYESFQVETSSEWFTVKRLLRSYAHSVTHGRYTPHTLGGENGQTVLGHGGDLEAFHELVRWLTMQRLTVSAVGNARDAICRLDTAP